MAGGLAARRAEMPRHLPLEQEALLQHGGELGRAVLEKVLVIALALAGEQRVEDIVAVVVPLRVEIAGWTEVAGAVALVLQHEMDLAIGDPAPDTRGERVEPVALGDGVDGVEAKPVEAVL